MADIITNTLQIGSNNLVLRDADAQEQLVTVKDGLTAVESDVTDLKEDYTTILDSAYVTDTASGSIASFPDGADNVPVKSLSVEIEPVQDLHGYENPWSAGGGKNKLPITVAGIKAANTSGTWSGNVYYINGGTFTIITDADGNVSGINANGTFTSTSSLVFINNSDMTTGFARAVLGQTIVLNGCPSRTGNPYVQMFNTWGTTSAIYDNGSGIAQLSIPSTVSGFRCEIQMYAGTVSNVLFKPMIRLASVSDATFAPYSNICPISGHSTAKVTRLGKNLLKMRTTKVTANGITIEPDGNGYVNISGTTGSSSYTYDLVDIPNAELTALFAMGGEYTLSLNKGTYNSTTLNVNVSYKETENGSTKYLLPNEHKTVPVGSIFLRASVWIPANTTPQQLTGFAIQLERNDTVTEFAPYQCQTVTIDLGGTRYGGTLDVGTGVLTVERVIVVASESMIHRNNGNSWWLGSYPAPKTTGSNYYDGVISDKFESRIADNQNVVFVNASGSIRLSTKTDYASIAEMYADIGQFSVVYPIASPFTVQLTANEISTLLGQNNIWSDAGTVDVEYRADTKLYINKVLNA